MADEIQNGQAEYGVHHVMEEEMRAAQQGVFEPKSGEAGQKRARKAAPASPDTKMEAAPENKAAKPSVAVAASSSRKAKAKKAK
jgi:hypothetical protein